MTVSYETQGDVALVIFDRPPVNAINSAVRAGLLYATTRVAADPSVRCLAIACRGRTFFSGADLEELNSGIQPPGYRETLAALENCTKPVIVSLHGTALGGGLEVALACHYRCATPDARVGMPEINLGILPGAGGTQRLPRLVGPAQALDMLVQGTPIDAQRARDLGLIDEILEGDAVSNALEFARRLIGSDARPRPTRDRLDKLKRLTADQIAEILERHARSLKGRTTQNLAVTAVQASTDRAFEEGLRLEGELSADSLVTAESRALRHVFFAERECSRIPGLNVGPRAPELRRAVVIGAGTMGTGIAIALADAGIDTWLVERESAALDRGLKKIDETYSGAVQRGRLSTDQAEAHRARIRGTLELEPARETDVVIEAVFEDFQLKRTVLQGVDQFLPDHALLATNTSSLSVTELAAATRRPERVIGLHFFSPANIMRLLEIVRGAATSGETIATAIALAKKLRKTGVVVGDAFGFVGNRMMLDGYFREVDLMLLQGIEPQRIDAVMQAFGFAMGPNRVNDMAGIDVGTRVRRELLAREARPAPYHVVSDALTGLGRVGQKAGRGIYRYEAGGRVPENDAELPALIAQLAEQYGVKPRQASDAEIEQRCVLSLVNIGADILAERLAYRAADIDVVWTSGYGFPRWRGGPMHYADSLGLGRVVEEIRALGESGDRRYWTPSSSLVDLARAGKSFADWDRERPAD
jgi:3-hydroxyacyl-CoA dehydrogenase